MFGILDVEGFDDDETIFEIEQSSGFPLDLDCNHAPDSEPEGTVALLPRNMPELNRCLAGQLN